MSRRSSPIHLPVQIAYTVHILYYTVLYYMILYYIILYDIIWYYIILYILYCIILYYIILYYIVFLVHCWFRGMLAESSDRLASLVHMWKGWKGRGCKQEDWAGLCAWHDSPTIHTCDRVRHAVACQRLHPNFPAKTLLNRILRNLTL
jgi:hypothetical protein